MVMLIDFILHIDRYLGEIVSNYGAATYLFLFLIIFLETGFVIAPFLPGDSLLFVAGAFAALGSLNIFAVFILVALASITGDSANYWIGRHLGKRFFEKNRFFKKEYLKRTEKYYKEHGAKTIVLARFIPIIRTFAPFVGGVGKMYYPKFLSFNIIGGIIWTALFVFAGFFFGNIPVVKDNLSVVILIIIVISIMPPIVGYFRNRNKSK